MIRINDKIISTEILLKKFSCDVAKCKGKCCLYGDAGAPLEDGELKELEKSYPVLKKYLPSENISVLENNGLYYKDKDNEWVTMLIDGKQCAYSIINNGIFHCAIERAFFDKKITFQKPLSCHMYPVKIEKHTGFQALNYDRWKICKPAIVKGEEENIPVFRFLKDSIVRFGGEKLFNEMEEIYKQIINDEELMKKLT